MRGRIYPARNLAAVLECTLTRYVIGVRPSATGPSGLKTFPDVAASRVFHPSVVAEIKATACDNSKEPWGILYLRYGMPQAGA